MNTKGFKYAGFGLLGVAAVFGFTFVVMLLWNWLVPLLFNGPIITFWEALGMIAIAVGLSEWLIGTRRAALTFWGVHLSTLLIVSLVIALPLHWAGSTLGSLVAISRDVGPSAGYFGSLGLVSSHLKHPWNLISGGIILIALEIALLHISGNNSLGLEVSADLAHIIAFPLGWYSAKIMNNREQFARIQT